MAKQLVEVPPVSPSSCVLNALVPQMGHELVEVPNVVSQSKFQQQFVEQTVDIPVHGGVKRAWRDVQGDLPGRWWQRFVELIFTEVLKALSQDRVQQRFVELIFTDVLKALPPGQGSAALRGAHLHGGPQGLVSGQGSAELIFMMSSCVNVLGKPLFLLRRSGSSRRLGEGFMT